MEVPLYIVDAFSESPFGGNQAAICLLTQEMSENTRQKLAAEMNLSETSYIELVKGSTSLNSFTEDSIFNLRWFTPTNEVNLCGHATMAAAAVLFFVRENKNEKITFQTLSGDLITRRNGDSITMDFPLNTPLPENKDNVQELLKLVVPDLNWVDSVHYSPSTKKLLVRLTDDKKRSDLENLQPNIASFQSVESSGRIKGVIVTVRAGNLSDNGDSAKRVKSYDFLSRYFAPWNGIPEDPVTGSAHTVSGGYWSGVLGKKTLFARQCSKRGGDVMVEVRDDGRVNLTGSATIVLKGLLTL